MKRKKEHFDRNIETKYSQNDQKLFFVFNHIRREYNKNISMVIKFSEYSSNIFEIFYANQGIFRLHTRNN